MVRATSTSAVLLCCALALAGTVEVLPSGARLVLAPMRDAERVCVTLMAAAEPWPDSETDYGLRHLVEHFAAKGPLRDVDRRLETHGAYLTAQTTRDAMLFSVEGGQDALGPAFDALREVLRKPSVSAEELEVERRILARELAQLEWEVLVSGAVWRAAFGDAGLDPIGTVEAWARATADDVDRAHRASFQARNLTIVVAGRFEAADARKRAMALLHEARPAQSPARSGELPSLNAPAVVLGPASDGRGVFVRGIDRPETLARVGVALALAPEAQAVYTPSWRAGLIVLVAAPGKLQEAIDLALADPAALAASASGALQRWLAPSEPRNVARLAAVAGRCDPRRTLADLARIAAGLTGADFAEALRAFRSEER